MLETIVWSDVIPQERIVNNPEQLQYELLNTSGFKPPFVPAILKPANRNELLQIIKHASENNIPLYTYSKGYNWGLGSKLPVQDNCTLIDLSALNKIIEVNEAFRYAIVEPGVTQQQLYEYLEANNFKLMLNVTGSWQHTSVLANMLERGSGFLGHRIDDLRGLEALLADGTTVRTGFWNHPPSERMIHHFTYGTGPDIKGLFSQSNMGIVTAAVVNLQPKFEQHKMVWCKTDEQRLPQLVEAIKELYARKYIFSAVHIGNDKRMKIENKNVDDVPIWTAMFLLSGSEAFCKFVDEEVKAKLAPLSDVYASYYPHELPDEHLKAIYKYHVGVPGDYFVQAMYQSVGKVADAASLDVDKGTVGMLCCLPIIPASAKDIADCVEVLNEMGKKYGNIPAATLNPLNDLYLEAVINIYFDLTSEESTQQAHRFNEALHERFFERGFRFYRYDITLGKKYRKYAPEYWEFIKKIKLAIDPKNIINPGRYSLV
jgi:4-cresol dehydrogenase (hydroxylating)